MHDMIKQGQNSFYQNFNNGILRICLERSCILELERKNPLHVEFSEVKNYCRSGAHGCFL